MKRVWSDVPRVYGAAFPVLVKGGKVLYTHRPTHVPDDVADSLVASGLASSVQPSAAPAEERKPRSRPMPPPDPSPATEKIPVGADSYARQNRRGLVKSCKERGILLAGDESRAELLRLLRGDK